MGFVYTHCVLMHVVIAIKELFNEIKCRSIGCCWQTRNIWGVYINTVSEWIYKTGKIVCKLLTEKIIVDFL